VKTPSKTGHRTARGTRSRCSRDRCENSVIILELATAAGSSRFFSLARRAGAACAKRNGSEIAADGVGASEIAADGVGALEIAADGVGTSEIASHAITGEEIFPHSITGEEIRGGTIQANHIADGGVGAQHVAIYERESAAEQEVQTRPQRRRRGGCDGRFRRRRQRSEPRKVHRRRHVPCALDASSADKLGRSSHRRARRRMPGPRPRAGDSSRADEATVV
jgi:hypothetical protein